MTGREAGLVETYGELVDRIVTQVRRRLPPQVPGEDLRQAGMLALVQAARSFRAARGASFETYAGIRIRGAVLDELRRYDWAPRSLRRRAREVAGIEHRLQQRPRARSHAHDVAAALGLDAARYQRLRDDLQRSHLESLDGASSTTKEVTDETYDLEHIVDTFRRSAMIERASAGLPQRESRVIALCFGQDRTLREAGSELGLTESRVCQLRASALRRLRSQFARRAVTEGA